MSLTPAQHARLARGDMAGLIEELQSPLQPTTPASAINGQAITGKTVPASTAHTILTLSFDHIPAELSSLKQWVLQINKEPYTPDRQRASSTNPTTWRNFGVVVDAFRRGEFDGIGFVFSGHHWGIDYDHVTDADGRFLDHEIEAEVRALTAAGAYVERSPSGTGVHVIGPYRGETLPGRKHGSREAYVVGRYFTVTGWPVPGITSAAALKDTTAVFLAWRQQHFRQTDTPTTAPSTTTMQGPMTLATLVQEDQDLVTQLRAQDPLFAALWTGDSSPYPGDASKADHAFFCILAKYLRNPERLESLARSSGLYRPKFDRPDYLPRTIAAALAATPTAQTDFTAVTEEGATMLDPKASWLERMNQDNFVVNHGREVVVYRPSYDPVLRRNKYDKHPFSAMEQLYRNDLVNVVQVSGKVVKQNKASAWLNHPQRRQYLKGAAYAPGRTLPDGTFNLDTGYGLVPKRGDWSLMRAHIKKVICQRDDQVDRYVMGWMADAVQHRGDRGQVALVLRGERGVGKGILGNALLQIFGQHGLYLSNSEQLVGKFNSHLEDASFLFGDECFFPGDKKHLSTLKALITESTIPIEAKFESVRMAKNCLHILLASNDQFVVPAGRDERRFCVLDVADTHKQNRAYFDPLRQELGLDADTTGQGTGAAAMLYDLLQFDLSSFDITKIPKTEALLDQKLHGLSATAKWLLDCLQHGRFDVPFAEGDQWETTAVTLTKANVYGTYRTFSKLAREYKSEEVGPWMKELKKLLSGCVQDSRPWSADGTRPRMLTFQKLADCRTAFETWIGHTIEWRTDAERDADIIKEFSEEIFG